MATCPECDAEVIVDEDDFEEMELGDPWDCEACGSRLRVAGLEPLEFESDDEDDDDDDEEEEEAAEDGEKPETEGETEDVDDLDEDDDADDDKDWEE